MSLPRYLEYKDSGVEWLGEVPRNWDVLALSRVLAAAITDGPHTTPVFVDDGIPFLSVDGIQDGELVFDGCRYVSADDHYEFSKKAKPARNDILMGKAASIGKIARVKTDLEFSIWSPLALIRPNVTACIPIFLEYTLKSKWLQAQIETLANSNTQLNIGMKDIPKLRLCLPPITEQTAIATFLDRETAKIDGLIAEQEKLITLLAEKRQATISHAVTKGLNTDTPMKDSGVVWLGEVPAHWAMKRVKHIKSPLPNAFVDGPFGSNLKSEHFIDGGDVYVIESNFATQNKIERSELKTISFTHFETVSRSEVRCNDIVIAKIGAQFGKASILPELDKRALVSGNSLKLTVNNEISTTQWAHLQLVNLKCSGEIDLLSNGSAQPALSLGAMNNLPFLLPPLFEQNIIIAFLDAEKTRLDALTSEATRGIALLKERRSALISAAVTGKIDVREANNQ